MKLIIDIPKDMFEQFKNEEIIDKYDEAALKQVFKNGTPLDDVKAEIEKMYREAEFMNEFNGGYNYAIGDVLEALRNIDKTESDDKREGKDNE